MQPIETQVEILNTYDKGQRISCRTIVNPLAAGLILPASWKARLGKFAATEEVRIYWEKKIRKAEACGPVGIRIEGFRTIFNEVIFLDMERPDNKEYQPILGPIILEQAHLDIDIIDGRLIPLGYLEFI